MARPSPFENARSFMVKGGMPITIGTIVLAAAMFVAWWATKLNDSWYPLIFTSDGWWARPWSIVTYAFLQSWFPTLVCGCLMAFFFMGALERSWSRSRFIPAYVFLLIAPPISLWIGALASGEMQQAGGLWLPTACWVVAYGSYRPDATILLMAIIPVKAKWLAWIAGLAIVFITGSGAPVAGLCAGLAPIAAWALGSRRLTLGFLERKQKSFRDEFGKSLKTKRESETERLKLRELLERSVSDEDRD